MHTGFFFSDPWNSESAASNSKPLTVCYLCDTTAWFRHTVLYTIWKQLQPRSTELFAQPEQPFLCSSIYVPSSNLLFTAAESDLRSFSSCPALHTHWISLHSWMQPAILQQHQAVLQYSWKEYQTYRRRATSLQAAAQSLCTSYAAHNKQGILSKSCQTFCRKQLAERFPVRATPGSCSIRQLAAHTPSGFQIAPLPANWNIFVLEDDWLCAGGLCIKHLAAAAKQRGYHCILSYNSCLLEPTPCHLLLPQIQTAFLSSNLFAPYPGTAQARYNLHTFYQKDFRQKEAVHAPFNRSIIRSLFQESAGMLSIAAKIDAVTQPYYQEALLPHAAEQAAASILQVLSNVL